MMDAPDTVTLEFPQAALPPATAFFPQRPYNPGAALCFVHVRKAAGTTVRLVAENAFPGDMTYPCGSPLSRGGYIPLKRSTDAGEDLRQYRMLSGHFGTVVSDHLEPGANLFTWLREPGDRVISDFFFFVIQERQAIYRPYLDRLDRGERVEEVFLDWLRAVPVDHDRQQVQLVYGNRYEAGLGAGLSSAAADALRRCFFIGLTEDQERSLDAFCAITSILPPRRTGRRNPGTNRPERLGFTADEQLTFDTILGSDRAFYALVRQVYERQMADLEGRGQTEPALALIGDRTALRQHILQEASNRTPVLTTWRAWDPVLGDNLDSREQLDVGNQAAVRWRWTASSPDTSLFFRLPRRTAFYLRIRLAPATPFEHATYTTLSLSGVAVKLIVVRGEKAIDLIAPVPATLANRLPDLTELHIHTAMMLDESTLVPYAGTRKLGLAIEEISAEPVSTIRYLWHRVGGPRLAKWTRPVLRRLRLSSSRLHHRTCSCDDADAWEASGCARIWT